MKRSLFLQTWVLTIVATAQLAWCTHVNAQDRIPRDNPRKPLITDGYCRAHLELEKSDPVEELRNLQAKFNDNGIFLAEIVYPEDVSRGTYSDFLEFADSYRLKIPIGRRGNYKGLDYLFAGYETELRELIQSESVMVFKRDITAPKQSITLRWGVIFYDNDYRRVGSIYFEEGGEYGAVNCRSVKFLHKPKLLWLFGKPNLYDWLVHNFSSVFEPGFSDGFLWTE